MKSRYVNLKVVVLAAFAAACTAPAFAADAVMISRFARDTGLSPAEVVLTLGHNYHVVEAQYYARPSMRGHLARQTRGSYDRRLSDLPRTHSVAVVAQLPPRDRLSP